MKTVTSLALAFGLTWMAVPTLSAGEVVVKKVHVCCPQCVKISTKVLSEVEGVSKPAASKETKTISFVAADDNAAQAGIAALAKEGFHGTATHGDKELAFPESGAKKGQKADSVTFSGVHLCCGQCVTGAKKALANVKGITAVEPDQKTRSVKITGKDIDLIEAVTAFNNAGFHGNLPKE